MMMTVLPPVVVPASAAVLAFRHNLELHAVAHPTGGKPACRSGYAANGMVPTPFGAEPLLQKPEPKLVAAGAVVWSQEVNQP